MEGGSVRQGSVIRKRGGARLFVHCQARTTTAITAAATTAQPAASKRAISGSGSGCLVRRLPSTRSQRTAILRELGSAELVPNARA